MSDVPAAETPSEQAPAYQPTPLPPLEPSTARAAAYQLPANPRALVRLSFCSAVTISSLMVLQDAAALLPAAKSGGQVAIQLAGLWLTTYLEWGLSFWALCLIVGIIGGGIRLDGDGIRLWRFGKKILWKDVRAIGLDDQPAFSAAFFLRPPASRLTIFSERQNKGKAPSLAAHAIPSFSFSQAEFQSLFGHISERVFGFVPSSPQAYVSVDSARAELRKNHSQGRIKRMAISALIAFGLIMLVGRTATSNYFYNTGNARLTEQNTEAARQNFEIASKINPTFPRAWDQLARAEFRLGRVSDAQTHWERALQLKPDLVESKLGLANIAVRQSNFNQARALLQKCISLQPRYIPGYLNLGDLEIRTGNPRRAEVPLLFVLKEEPKNHRAFLLLARAKMKQHDYAAAGRLLATLPPGFSVGDRELATLIQAEHLTSTGNLPAADEIFRHFEAAGRTSFEEFMERAKYYKLAGNDAMATKCLDQAQVLRKEDVWPSLYKAEMALRAKRTKDFEQLIATATSQAVQDPAGLVFAGKLLAESGQKDAAREVTMRALMIDPDNEAGLEAVGSMLPPRQADDAKH